VISTKYKNWIATLDLFTCFFCRSSHGQIYRMDEFVMNEPPVHPNCRCIVEPMKARLPGTATQLKEDGADWWLRETGKLPDYYISEIEARKLGYRGRKGNLNRVAPGKMLTKGVYYNDDGHLPSSPGRIWFEADINYNPLFFYRGPDRILFSNDGLIFVTYDHYHTFEEII